jgi:DNA-binding transcriptional regulator YdaS (Cro superfamily)
MLNTVDEVVEALGGTAAVAALTGVTAPAVSNWRERGAIPSEYFLRIGEALRGDGWDVEPSVFSFKPVVVEEART